eukprot:2498654-Amphidinium_carterae.1
MLCVEADGAYGDQVMRGDYGCLPIGPEGKQASLVMLKDKRTGCLAATQITAKSAEPYALSFVAGWLRGLGYKCLVLKSDNERSNAAVRTAAHSLVAV